MIFLRVRRADQQHLVGSSIFVFKKINTKNKMKSDETDEKQR